MKFFKLNILLLLLAATAFSQNPMGGNGGNHPNVKKIVVERVLQTSNYTYLLTAEGNMSQWMAVPKMEAEVGQKYYYQGGMQMGQFRSKELDTIFSAIMFVGGLVDPDIVEGGTTDPEKAIKETIAKDAEDNVYITPPKGAITIEELYTNKEKYAGQVVKIKGRVKKFNSQIMGKNWVHIIDGSGKTGNNDLTATSQETVKLNDVIVLEGTIVLDKDFGAGYFFEVIMEEAQLIK